MSDPLFIYAGPSWASTSYPVEHDATNLALEWQLPCINVSQPGSSFTHQLLQVKQCLETQKLPVIWVYNDPLTVLPEASGLSYADFMTRNDWQDTRAAVNRWCLTKINELPVPVLLIGGHCDVFDCDHANIAVAHASWQKWLAVQSGMHITDDVIQVTPADGGNYPLQLCWGAEILQKMLHDDDRIKPSPTLLDAIWDIYYFWEELERRGWFFEVHPNRRAHVEFARFLAPAVKTFLETNHGQTFDQI